MRVSRRDAPDDDAKVTQTRARMGLCKKSGGRARAPIEKATREGERERVLSRQLAFVPSLFLSLFCAAAAADAIARTFGEIRSYAAASVRPHHRSLV